MIKKELNRFEYIFLSQMNKVDYVEIFKGEYQKLKVGDKVLCYYENEEIEAYVSKLHYLLPLKDIIEGVVFDEEKYGKLFIYLTKEKKEIDQNYYISEYFEYKKLLEESKRANFNILSKKMPEDISKTKIGLPCKIINPLLMDNVLSSLFNLPKRILHNLMKQALVINTLDDEFISRKASSNEGSIYLTGLEAIEYLYKKLNINHPILKEEDIFIDEIYIYPQYWERMFVEDNEENEISFAYRSLVNRCKFITMLRNNEDDPMLVIENEKRMMYEKYVYLLERFINDGLLIKRW